ncbi:hypothetical protein BJV77DRAFT_1024997, partial [Russula vinacea]
ERWVTLGYLLLGQFRSIMSRSRVAVEGVTTESPESRNWRDSLRGKCESRWKATRYPHVQDCPEGHDPVRQILP